jgi:hypothetical protein
VPRPSTAASASRSAPGSVDACTRTVESGASARAECAWIACATSRLPTPASPFTSTGACEPAARPMSFHTACIGALRPTSGEASTGPSSAAADARRCRTARSTVATRRGRSNGFVR